MRRSLFALLLLASMATQAQDIIYTPEDSVFVTRTLKKHAGSNKEMGQLLLAIAHEFIGHKYVAGTLEKGIDEPLTVNTKEVDCTTFVEQVLAMAVTTQQGDSNFGKFTENLESIRYRNGKRKGYASRLHYMSMWIADNAQKGFIDEICTAPYSQKETIALEFMSKHPGSYKILKDNDSLVTEIAAWEAKINGTEVCRLPKSELWRTSDALGIKEGDIIILTTNIEGLDAVHVGIAFLHGNEVRLLHASSAAGKVIKEERSLYEYQKGKKNHTGIRVIRAKPMPH